MCWRWPSAGFRTKRESEPSTRTCLRHAISVSKPPIDVAYARSALALDDRAIEQLSRLHLRLCPRQVLGLRIGQRAGELIGIALPQSDKRMLAIVEMDGCFADAVSVATGCWVGRRTLRVVDFGKVGATFVDLRTLRAVRIWPDATARRAAETYAQQAPDRWHAQIEGYRVMPSAELMRSRDVSVRMQLKDIQDPCLERVTCNACGEEIMNQRQIVSDRFVLCRACAGEAYYASIDQAGRGPGACSDDHMRTHR